MDGSWWEIHLFEPIDFLRVTSHLRIPPESEKWLAPVRWSDQGHSFPVLGERLERLFPCGYRWPPAFRVALSDCGSGWMSWKRPPQSGKRRGKLWRMENNSMPLNLISPRPLGSHFGVPYCRQHEFDMERMGSTPTDIHCLCVCVYNYVYIYIYTCIPSYVYIYILYTYSHIQTYIIHICKYIYISHHIYVYIYMYHIYMYIYISKQMHVCTYIYMYHKSYGWPTDDPSTLHDWHLFEAVTVREAEHEVKKATGSDHGM